MHVPSAGREDSGSQLEHEISLSACHTRQLSRWFVLIRASSSSPFRWIGHCCQWHVRPCHGISFPSGRRRTHGLPTKNTKRSFLNWTPTISANIKGHPTCKNDSSASVGVVTFILRNNAVYSLTRNPMSRINAKTCTSWQRIVEVKYSIWCAIRSIRSVSIWPIRNGKSTILIIAVGTWIIFPMTNAINDSTLSGDLASL